jgi:hypothetical protein
VSGWSKLGAKVEHPKTKGLDLLPFLHLYLGAQLCAEAAVAGNRVPAQIEYKTPLVGSLKETSVEMACSLQFGYNK